MGDVTRNLSSALSRMAVRGVLATDLDDSSDVEASAGDGVLVTQTTTTPSTAQHVIITDGTDIAAVGGQNDLYINVNRIAEQTPTMGLGTVAGGTQRIMQAQPANAALLTAATTGGLGGVVDLGMFCSNFVMQVTASDGTATTTDLICLLGSVDGGEFFILAQSAAGLATEFNTVGGAGTNARGYTSKIPARYIRAGIGTVTDGHFTATATAVGGTATITAQGTGIPA